MTIKHNVSISYSEIFDDYDKVDIKELLKDIPTKSSLQIIGHFSAQIHAKEQDNSRQSEFLQMWLKRFPKEIALKVVDFIKKTNQNGLNRFNLINNISNLMLCEYIIENHNELAPVADLTIDQELNLFKAYLWCSQQWTDKQNIGLEKPKDIDDFAKIFIKVQFPYQELIEFKDFRIQFIKAIHFFKFCERNQIFSGFLKIFL